MEFTENNQSNWLTEEQSLAMFVSNHGPATPMESAIQGRLMLGFADGTKALLSEKTEQKVLKSKKLIASDLVVRQYQKEDGQKGFMAYYAGANKPMETTKFTIK